MRKILLIFISFILVAGFIYFFFNFFQIKTIKATIDPDEARGWAWFGTNCTDSSEAISLNCIGATTTPIGWISFNSENIDCGVGDDPDSYQVRVNYSIEEISGAAWVGIGEDAGLPTDCNITENTVGWLNFDYAGSDWPSGITPDYDFPAKVVNIGGGQYEIRGWAPIVNNSTIVTWVRFKGTATDGSAYSVKINNNGTVSTNLSERHAWLGKGSDGGLGWIDFHPDGFPGVIFPPPPSPPTVSNLSESFANKCAQSRIPTLSWTTDAILPYDYEIQICSNSTCTGAGDPLVPPILVPNTNSTSWLPTCSGCCGAYNQIQFGGNTYSWQVRARNTGGSWSSWTTSNFTTLAHCAPDPGFEAPTITVDAVVTFKDNSLCYPTTGSDFCKNFTGPPYDPQYLWDFGNGQTSNYEGDATTTYSSTGPYTVTLTITDDVGTCSTPPKTLNVKPPLPDWKEIPPIIWLKNLFASVGNFFRAIF